MNKTIATITIRSICVALFFIAIITSVTGCNIRTGEEPTEQENQTVVHYEVGDFIPFGAYEQDNNTSNGKESLEWLVLEIKNDKALLISKYAIDCRQYNSTRKEITWETCSLRRWLNNDFFESTFTDKEKSIIPSMTVSADKNPNSYAEPGKATQDKVFLLSVTEVNSFFSYSERKCQATQYAKARGSETSDGNCWWWLRSPGINNTGAAVVDCDGIVTKTGKVADLDGVSLRPVIWVDLTLLYQYRGAV